MGMVGTHTGYITFSKAPPHEKYLVGGGALGVEIVTYSCGGSNILMLLFGIPPPPKHPLYHHHIIITYHHLSSWFSIPVRVQNAFEARFALNNVLDILGHGVVENVENGSGKNKLVLVKLLRQRSRCRSLMFIVIRCHSRTHSFFFNGHLRTFMDINGEHSMPLSCLKGYERHWKVQTNIKHFKNVTYIFKVGKSDVTFFYSNTRKL